MCAKPSRRFPKAPWVLLLMGSGKTKVLSYPAITATNTRRILPPPTPPHDGVLQAMSLAGRPEAVSFPTSPFTLIRIARSGRCVTPDFRQLANGSATLVEGNGWPRSSHFYRPTEPGGCGKPYPYIQAADCDHRQEWGVALPSRTGAHYTRSLSSPRHQLFRANCPMAPCTLPGNGCDPCNTSPRP